MVSNISSGTKATGDTGNPIVLVTDLDGTLLEYDTYSFELVAPIVTKLNQAGIPIVFCSSKTRAEQEIYRRSLQIKAPFIVENGAAIFIEPSYFPFCYKFHRYVDGYQVIEIGIPYEEIRRILQKIKRESNLDFRGFGDMNIAEISELTGLNLEATRLASKRCYEETLNLTGSEPEIGQILKRIEEAGLTWSRGTRFYSIGSGNDKGKAARIVLSLFKRKLGGVKTIAIGDSASDIPMLTEVDIPVLVERKGKGWQQTRLPDLRRVCGVGPLGWVKAVQELIPI